MATEFSAFMEEIEREAEAEGPTAVAELRHLQEAARDTRSAMHEPASAASAIAFSHGRPFLRACNYCGVETHERLAWQVRKPGATLGATAGDRSIACCE
ncbi:MAG: hypothetical protein Q8S13_09205, partial [Dehalococcoidia bacterium]|nr:hypothetical protein [Dehalococcoidia bacterium]